MQTGTITDERERMASLTAARVLDTRPEASFDAITTAASTIARTPIALVSLVDSDRQWFKSRVGLDASETPREVAFCNHAIRLPHETMVVHDATADARFADNPLVVDDPHIRFYAGFPLRDIDGRGMGTLCVIDRRPRELAVEQRTALRGLADAVELMLELRRRVFAEL